MSIVLDYTARIAPAALKAAGVSGVCRYLKPLSVPAYAITVAEYRELISAGIRVTLNWEYDARDWMGGASRGAAHGTEAARQARQVIGYPAGDVIVGSADFDMSRAEWDSAGHGYAQAFATAIRAAGFRPGVYGPWDVLTWVREAGIMDAFWQSMSTAFSSHRNANPWPYAHLWQRGYKTVAGQSTDRNDILIPDWGNGMAGEIADAALRTLDGGNALGDVYLRIVTGKDNHGKPSSDGAAVANLTTLSAKVDGLTAAAKSEATTLATLVQLLQAATAGGGAPLDTAAVTAAIVAEHETTRALLVTQHTADMAALTREHAAVVAGLRAELAAYDG